MNEKFFDLNREKQDRIINASLKAFAENGYRHASTDNIVKDAGISKGLLFHYFSSKTGLYTFLFDYSVKYMIFEYDRMIDKNVQDYFTIRKDMEKAKLNVLRNYPYMAQFIESGLNENTLDIIAQIEEPRHTYLATVSGYTASAKKGELIPSLTEAKVEAFIRYTVDGLTRDMLREGSFQPEMLYRQICDYIDTLHAMSRG